MTDNGAPKNSWTARMANGTTVTVDKDVSFLGLEIGDGKNSQTLIIPKGFTLTGQSEVRVADKGKLLMNGGTIESLRWLEVMPGAALAAHGQIKAAFYNKGTVQLSVSNPLEIEKEAVLGGILLIHSDRDLKKGEAVTVLKAESITGRFENHEVEQGGKRYKISYTETTVSVTLQ